MPSRFPVLVRFRLLGGGVLRLLRGPGDHLNGSTSALLLVQRVSLYGVCAGAAHVVTAPPSGSTNQTRDWWHYTLACVKDARIARHSVHALSSRLRGKSAAVRGAALAGLRARGRRAVEDFPEADMLCATATAAPAVQIPRRRDLGRSWGEAPAPTPSHRWAGRRPPS